MLKIIKKICLFLAVILLLAKLLTSGAVFFYPKVNTDDDLSIKASDLIDLTNNYRQDQGLKTLTVNPRLTQAAFNKARDLLTDQYFDHTSPEGKKFSAWIKEVNYNYFYVGENLAIDFEQSQDVFAAWLASPTHQENLVRPQYQETGVAVLSGKFKNHPTIVVAQLFGTRILGETESKAADSLPLDNLADQYFYQSGVWQKISLENLIVLDHWLNYLIFISIGACLITHRRQKRINQINIKQPIINRYQAKVFRE